MFLKRAMLAAFGVFLASAGLLIAGANAESRQERFTLTKFLSATSIAGPSKSISSCTRICAMRLSWRMRMGPFARIAVVPAASWSRTRMRRRCRC